MRKCSNTVSVGVMTTRRFALKIRVSEMMEILDGIRGQGITNVVAIGGVDCLLIHDIEGLYYALDNLGDQISIKSISLGALEAEYEAIRKSLLALVVRMAQITVSMTGPLTVVDRYDYAVRV
jgi:hypothetical protein